MTGRAILVVLGGVALWQYGGSAAGLSLATLGLTLVGVSMLLGGGGGLRLPLVQLTMPSPALFNALLLDLGLAILVAFALDDVVHSSLSGRFVDWFAEASGIDLYAALVDPLGLFVVPLVIMFAQHLHAGAVWPSPVDLVGLAGSIVLIFDRTLAIDGIDYAALAVLWVAVAMVVAAGYLGVWGAGGWRALLLDRVGIALFGVLALVARVGPWALDYLRLVVGGAVEVDDPAAAVVGLVLALLVLAFVAGIVPRAAVVALGYLLGFFAVVDAGLVGPSRGFETGDQLQVVFLLIITGLVGSMVGRLLVGRRS